MSPLFALSLWSTSLVVLVCYAWWSRFRVWVLRQDLFAIRDEAWDAMRAKGMLDDPAHREFREHVNAMIRFAPDLTFLTFCRLVMTNRAPAIKSKADIPAEIRAFRNRVFLLLARYLLFGSLTAWVLVSVALVFQMFSLTNDWMTRTVARIFDSPDLSEFARTRPGRTAPGF
jgi:hypothetical protein